MKRRRVEYVYKVHQGGSMKGEKLEEHLSLRVTARMKERLLKMAEDQNRRWSDMVRRKIEELLQEDK